MKNEEDKNEEQEVKPAKPKGPVIDDDGFEVVTEKKGRKK